MLSVRASFEHRRPDLTQRPVRCTEIRALHRDPCVAGFANAKPFFLSPKFVITSPTSTLSHSAIFWMQKKHIDMLKKGKKLDACVIRTHALERNA